MYILFTVCIIGVGNYLNSKISCDLGLYFVALDIYIYTHLTNKILKISKQRKYINDI